MPSSWHMVCGIALGMLLPATSAAVVLGTDAPRAYAAELVDGTLLSDPGDIASVHVGYNFSDGEVRYGRFACTDNLTMDSVTIASDSPDLTLGAVNGEGTNAIFFSITAGPMPAATAGQLIHIDPTNILVRRGAVDCAFSIHDYPSQAHAGGVDGRIHTSGWQPYVARPSGYIFGPVVDRPAEAIADVEAPAGAYFDFTLAGPDFASLAFEASPGVLLADGSPVTLAAIFDPDTSFTVEGDFSAATQVWVDDAAGGSRYAPDVLLPDRATFIGDLSGIDADLEFEPTSTQAIPESRYTALLSPVPNPGFVVPHQDPVIIGAIVHNGAELQAPLVQLPGGWKSRIVLTNTGGIERPYTISVMGETGNVIGVDSTKLTGWLPATGQKVIELDEILLTFSGKRRAMVVASVAAPDDQIQGQYQIVGPDGSVDNLIMVRAGTN